MLSCVDDDEPVPSPAGRPVARPAQAIVASVHANHIGARSGVINSSPISGQGRRARERSRGVGQLTAREVPGRSAASRQGNSTGASVKNEHATVNGSTFVVSDALGDILRGAEHGFFHADTRFLSALTITVNGARPVPLSSYSNAAHSALFHATNPALASIPAETLLLVRARDVTDQLCEHLTVTNYGSDAVELCIAFDCAADFADIFEVRGLASIGREARAKADRERSLVRYQSRVGGLLFSTVVRASNQPQMDSGRIDYSFGLASHQSWAAELV